MLTGVLSELKAKAGLLIHLLLVSLLTPGFNQLQAQDQDPVSDLKNFSSVTPNAYAFSQIDNVPANYHTGQIKPSLPLFQKKMSMLSFAMSLDWLGGGGIKMDDPGSIVGKGWALNAGGMIVRNMRDLADDYKTTSSQPLYSGVLYNSGVLAIPDGEGDPFQSNLYNWNHVDMQHDIFQFNFAGRSGKFYIGKNKEVLVVDGSKLQIIPNYNTSTTITGNEIRSFTIVDEAGIRYTFDQEEISRTLNGSEEGAFSTQFYTTGWLLSKIESPYNEESITIEYYQRSFDLHFYGSMYYRRSIRTESADPYGHYKNFFHNYMGAGADTRPFDIKSVTFSDGIKINVNYFAITYSAPDPVVRQIEISGTGGNVIKKFNLNYLSWDRQGKFNYYNFNQVNPLQSVFMPGKEYMHLESVDVAGPDNKQSALYTFSYYLDAAHNEALSYNNQSMDYWGFHNGQVNTGDLIPVPFLNLPGANRSVNLEHTLTGALKSITYPTGGSEEFEYGLNEKLRHTVGGDQTVTVAGLRLKKRILHDGVNSQNDITKEYRYINTDGSSSGFLGDPLEFRYLMHTYDGGWPNNPHIKFTDTVDVSMPVNPTSFIDGSLIAYKRVEEILQKGPLSNGKIVYEYSDLSYAATWTPRDYFPYSPVERPTWAIGLPLSTTWFNAQNDPVKKIVNQYDISQNYYQVENYRSLYYALRAHNTNTPAAPFYVYKYRNHYPLLGRSDLKKTDMYEYTPAGILHTVTEYVRNPVYQLVNKTRTTDSRGRITESVIRYPLDYNPGSIAFIDDLVNKNMLSIPIATETWKEDGGVMKLLNATATEFAVVNGMQRPFKTYRTDMAAPLAVSNVFDPLVLLNQAYPFQPSIVYNNYDSYGRLLSSTMEPGKQKALVILDRTGNTLAKAYNASSAQIAFTSFENNNGSWSYVESGVTTAEKKTGNKGYNGALSRSGLSSGNYIVRFWAKGNGSITVNGVSQAVTNTWTFYSVRFSNINSVNINTNGNYIDEVAVSPVLSTLQSFTYNDDLQVTSESDNSGWIKKYEYDGFGRLLVTRDNEEKIMQAVSYENRQFYNQQKSVTLSNYCAAGQVSGPPVTYPVPANSYVSAISQADADQKAQWDIDYNALAYARNTGGCTTIQYNYEIWNDAVKNDCPSGYEGSRVIYTVPYGKYSSLISQADAQAKAQADLDANVQKNANDSGKCYKVVDFYANNYAGVEGYVVNLISKANGYQYIFNIEANGGLLGQLPLGLYELHIFNTGGDTIMRSFSIACSYYTEGNSVDIDNVNITESCPNVTIW
jgi:YD repeat-containing protein